MLFINVMLEKYLNRWLNISEMSLSEKLKASDLYKRILVKDWNIQGIVIESPDKRTAYAVAYICGDAVKYIDVRTQDTRVQRDNYGILLLNNGPPSFFTHYPLVDRIEVDKIRKLLRP